MQLMKQSEALGAKTEIFVVLRDDATNLVPQTGVTASAGDIKIGKGHAAEANHAGTWTEIGLGRYTYQFTAGEIDTLGITHFTFKKTGVREFPKEIQVVPWDPFLNQDATLNALQADVTAIKAKTDLLPASVATSGSVAAVQADVTAIRAKTDAFPASPATAAAVAAVQTDIDNIQTRLPTALTAAGRMQSDILAINGTVVQGNGATPPWGP